MQTTTEMKHVSIDKLIPYVNNARTHNAEQITNFVLRSVSSGSSTLSSLMGITISLQVTEE